MAKNDCAWKVLCLIYTTSILKFVVVGTTNPVHLTIFCPNDNNLKMERVGPKENELLHDGGLGGGGGL
jgi:hypothetical protein